MNIPGFSAEASLFNVNTRYQATTEASFYGGIIQPASDFPRVWNQTCFDRCGDLSDCWGLPLVRQIECQNAVLTCFWRCAARFTIPSRKGHGQSSVFMPNRNLLAV